MLTAAAAVIVLLPLATAAQTPRRVTLGPATATLSEDFSQIASMRELSDGRVLVTDFRDQRVAVGDFRSNSAKTIGRRGDGPGEYVLVNRLLPFNGDTTLMAFEGARRWTVITPDLKFSTIPPDSRVVEMFGHGLVVGGDRRGYLLTQGNPLRKQGIERDTSPLLLLAPKSAKFDTIGRTDGGEAPHQPPPGPEKVSAYQQYDNKAMGADGWIVVVRHNPYRVEWRSPDGRWRVGPVVDEPPVPVTGAEKQAFFDRRAKARANAATKVITVPGVVKTNPGVDVPEPEFIFPEVIPPFAAGFPPLISPHGEVLVRRNRTAASTGPLFDVFDRRGVRVYQLATAANQRPIAFGASCLYVVTTDDDGIERLSRHAWPIPGVR
jgi:hypothetical protein